MRINIIIFNFFVLVSIISCGQVESVDAIKNKIHLQIQNQTGIDIPEFVFTNKETSQTSDDIRESFEILFDSLNFETLIDRITNSSNFKDEYVPGLNKEIDESTVVTYDIVNLDTGGKWVRFESGFKYLKRTPNRERYGYYVNPDRKSLYYYYSFE